MNNKTPDEEIKDDTILGWKEVQPKTGGKSRVTIWRWEQKGIFPKRVRTGPNSIGWFNSQINEWHENLKNKGEDR